MDISSKLFMRYTIVALALVLIFVSGIALNAFQSGIIDAKHWQAKADSLKTENIIIKPYRGNILSSDGQLMSASIPQYYLFIDFKNVKINQDTLMYYLPELSKALSEKFGDKTPQEYREHFIKGYKSRNGRFRIYNKRVSYSDLKELKTYPYLKFRVGKNGFFTEMMVQRVKPFGSLASRTIGNIYGEFEKGGKNGVELSCDSLLKGIPGYATKQKIRGTWTHITTMEPENGMDVKTTIDIKIQDITERALVDMLKKIDAESGTAVVMEVKTGQIKAITNMARMEVGSYGETVNYAVSDQSEPGSTFKVVSMMAALEDKLVKPSDTIDVGGGIYMYANARMTDHNWHRGGYGRISAAQSIWYSSNIGVAKVILRGYGHHPEKYVERIRSMSFDTPMDLEIPGSGRAIIKHPVENKSKWWKTSLPWMSFGYETQIPPIYTLRFFNAIANNGTMVNPYFVQEVLKNGEILETRSSKIINPKICSDETLVQIKQMLLDVVEKGTGSAAKPSKMRVAGKTGTAQISQGAGGYKADGRARHQVSFCGYFPAEDPQYSCIVVIRYPNIGYPSGGVMAGGVFREIAQQIYSQTETLTVNQIPKDSVRSPLPIIKSGYYPSISLVANKFNTPWTGEISRTNPWVCVGKEKQQIQMREYKCPEKAMPHVVGMGAKDALFLLESKGIKVSLHGRGTVQSQSIPAGNSITQGMNVVLELN